MEKIPIVEAEMKGYGKLSILQSNLLTHKSEGLVIPTEGIKSLLVLFSFQGVNFFTKILKC